MLSEFTVADSSVLEVGWSVAAAAASTTYLSVQFTFMILFFHLSKQTSHFYSHFERLLLAMASWGEAMLWWSATFHTMKAHFGKIKISLLLACKQIFDFELKHLPSLINILPHYSGDLWLRQEPSILEPTNTPAQPYFFSTSVMRALQNITLRGWRFLTLLER